MGDGASHLSSLTQNDSWLCPCVHDVCHLHEVSALGLFRHLSNAKRARRKQPLNFRSKDGSKDSGRHRFSLDRAS